MNILALQNVVQLHVMRLHTHWGGEGLGPWLCIAGPSPRILSIYVFEVEENTKPDSCNPKNTTVSINKA